MKHTSLPCQGILDTTFIEMMAPREGWRLLGDPSHSHTPPQLSICFVQTASLDGSIPLRDSPLPFSFGGHLLQEGGTW